MVYVISKTGQPIMPTNNHAKVRRLLRCGKARVVKKTPFTIQLVATSKTYVQEIASGMEASPKNIGLDLICSAAFHGKEEYKMVELNKVNTSGFRTMDNEDDFGIVVGKNPASGKLVVHDGKENALVMGASRCGKGTNTVIPTAFAWKKSAFFLDYKGEIWHLTAGYRKEALKQRVIKFEPFCQDGSSDRWNPLSEIRLGTEKEFADARSLGYMLLSEAETANHDNSYLIGTAAAYLSGIILMLLHKAQDEGAALPCLGDVADYLKSKGMEDILAEMEASPSRASEQAAFVKMLHGTIRNSITKIIQQELAIYDDPDVRKNTKVSDFALSDLLAPGQDISLYLVIHVQFAKAARPVARLMVSKLLADCLASWEGLADKAEDAHAKNKLLLMLDEFCQLGYMRDLEMALPVSGMYGTKICLVCQEGEQIARAYGKENLIDSKHLVNVCFASLAKDGYVVEAVCQQGASSHGDSSYLQGERGKLIRDEMASLYEDKVFVLTEGRKAFTADKVRYYTEEAFSGKVMEPPKAPEKTA